MSAPHATTIHDSHIVVFFDFETTGLDVVEDDIIEIGAQVDPISVNRRRTVAGMVPTFTSLVRLDKQSTIDPGATSIHGITTFDVEQVHVESFHIVWAKLLAWLDTWRSATGQTRVVLVAHNCYGYDQLILSNTMKRDAEKRIAVPSWIQFSDSLIAMRSAYVGQYKSFALQKLASALGVEVDQAHRALSDVGLLIRVMNAFPYGCASIYDQLLKIIQPKLIDRSSQSRS